MQWANDLQECLLLFVPLMVIATGVVIAVLTLLILLSSAWRAMKG